MAAATVSLLMALTTFHPLKLWGVTGTPDTVVVPAAARAGPAGTETTTIALLL
jgi:hypothetical protein